MDHTNGRKWLFSGRACPPLLLNTNTYRHINSGQAPPLSNLYIIACFVCLLISNVKSTSAEGPIAVPVDGKPFVAELKAVDAKWNLSFDSAGKQQHMPAAELVRWGTCAEVPNGPVVVTASAGLLVADVLTADRKTLTADSLTFGSLELPIRSLAGVAFDLPAEPQRRDLLLDRIARAEGNSDRIVLHNGDEITCEFIALKGDVVKLATDIGPIDVKTERIAAVIFNPTLRQKTPDKGLHAWVGFSDGSVIPATRLVVNEKELKITTTTGQTWGLSQFSRSENGIVPFQKCGTIVFLQPLGGRVTYLSDLEAAEYRHTPYLDLRWPYRRNRNVTAGRLRSAGRIYLKGIGVHSTARLTYLLDRPYKRFQAELGIDDSTAGCGSVQFRVLVDNHERYRSETIRGGDVPIPVSVDITDGKRLDLIVDFADRADEQDHADWLDARLIQ